MRTSNSCPIFVDGAKVCEATSVSYTVEEPVEFSGSGLPGPTVVEKDPPEYTITAELPGEIYAPITHESRVEVAIPPAMHGGSAWKVIEVWEIHQFELTSGLLELSAWQGSIHTDVDYLGFDTDETSGGERQTPEQHRTLEVLSESPSEDSDEDDDDDFDAQVHDI